MECKKSKWKREEINGEYKVQNNKKGGSTAETKKSTKPSNSNGSKIKRQKEQNQKQKSESV